MREIISAPWEHMGSQTIYCVVGMSLHLDLQLPSNSSSAQRLATSAGTCSEGSD